MVDKALFSSNSGEHETPDDLFAELNAEFNFTLDPAATPKNAKCENYYTKAENGIVQPWPGNVFCNPPYGREVGKWIIKGRSEAANGSLVVMLLPARTDTKWFHDYIEGQAEVRFIAGRLKFSNSKNSDPFPSMVVIYWPSNTQVKKMIMKRKILKSGWKPKGGQT